MQLSLDTPKNNEETFELVDFWRFSIQDLRRDLQAVIVAKTGAAWETHGGETFLSEQIAVGILDETKQALIRCHTVSIAILLFVH